MAEIARLGMQVDATGVTQMRQELLALASSAAQAAKQIESSGGAVERTGEKFGNPIGGFYEFDRAAQKADKSIKPLAKSIAGATAAMIDFGPAGNAAANALQAVLISAGPMAIAMGVVATAIAFVSSRVEAARKELAQLAEQELQQVQRATENLKLDQSFRQQLKVFEAIDPEIETIRQKYEQLTISAQKSGADQETLARLSRLAGLEQKKVLDDRLAATAKEQQAIQQQIAGVQFAQAAVGASAQQTIALTAAQQLNSIATSEMATKHGALAQELARETVALAQLQEAQARLQAGRQGVTDFQNTFGVTFDFERQQAGNQLADKFASTFNTFKDDPRAQGQLNQAFGSLVTQAISIGVPDIGELLASKIGGANFQRLRATLDDDLRSALDSTTQAGQQWGETFRQQFTDFTTRAGNVGESLRAIDSEWATLTQSVAQQMAVNIDVNSALSNIQQVQAQLNAIPDVTYKQVIVQTFASGSPMMPFSDYFNSYVPQQLASISGLSPEVAVNIPGFSDKVNQLRAIEEKQRQIRNSFTQSDALSASPINRLNREAAGPLLERLARESEQIKFELGLEAARAQQQRGGSSGGGGGSDAPPVVVNLDLTGATLSREFLDEEMIPAIERGIIRATGQDPGFRVEN